MKKTYIALTLMLILTISFAWAADTMTMSKSDKALKMLKEGNERFVSGQKTYPHLDQKRMEDTAKNGQFPFATVLTCSDSRVPVNHIFNVGIGDVFTIKVAGNVAGISETASIEYGVEHLHTPIIVVMGHTHCGAVSAAAANAETHGTIPFLLQRIKPAVERVNHNSPDLKGKALINEYTKANVRLSAGELVHVSPVIRKKLKDGSLKIVGALYDIETGKIEWFNPLPEKKKKANQYTFRQSP